MSEEHNKKILPQPITLQLRLKNMSETDRDIVDTNIMTLTDLTEQITEFARLSNLTHLSISANELSYVPNTLPEYLGNLIDLDLSNNRLQDLPDNLDLLTKLQCLNLSCNSFSFLPKVVRGLTDLRSLKMHKNQINEVPPNMEVLIKLEELDLSSNKLKDLPLTCSKLNRLQNLSLADNKFSRIPDCVVSGMYSLKVFDFSKNLKAELNIPIKSTNLREFYATKNVYCPSFPVWTISAKYSNLEILSLDETVFNNYHFPGKPSKSKIKKLSMIHCDLSDHIIEKITEGMSELKELIVGSEIPCKRIENAFWRMPVQHLQMASSLETINVCNTGIPMVPKTIEKYQNLRNIDISNNNISWLPEEFCSLKNLEILIANNSQIALLPKNIGNLTLLKELNVSYNKLCQIPESMRFVENLLFLDLYDNDFESVPETIEKLPNLIGLDFEQNYFSTDDFLINGGVRYENMKTALRKHWADKKKVNGLKTEIIDDYDRRSYESSSSRENISQFDNPCDLPNVNNDIPIQDEHWDISDDSADEFDPTEGKVPVRRCASPLVYYQPKQRVFCPAKSHEERIITRVIRMLRDGKLFWPSDFEEGQFEDP